jgi:hypothetical protein
VEDTRKFFSAVLEGSHLVGLHLGDLSKTLKDIEQACATKKNPKKTIEQILLVRSKQDE